MKLKIIRGWKTGVEQFEHFNFRLNKFTEEHNVHNLSVIENRMLYAYILYSDKSTILSENRED